MAKFKASSSSSGFVSVSVAVLILLAVIINIYPAPAAAAAAESLEAVEEVAKDQGTTEVASVHHHEIRGRVVLQDGIGSSFIKGVTGVIKGIGRYKPRYKPSPRGPRVDLQDYYNYLDTFCRPTFCYIFGPSGYSSCKCGRYPIQGGLRCLPNAVSYCCLGGYGLCTGCCLGSSGPRRISP